MKRPASWQLGGFCRRRPARRAHPAGVSLLEVLIAVGVLSIGLLGVAAILPVGRFEIMQAGKADRSAACGHAGLRDVKVRGMLNPYRWRYRDGSDVWLLHPSTGRPGIPFGVSFAVDPYYISYMPQDATDVNAADPTISVFPYQAGTMRRVSLVPWAGPSSPLADLQACEALFDRIFTWDDDLVFTLPEEKTERPRQMILDSADVGRPFPWLQGDEPPSTPQPLVAQVAGKYSWMATVSPLASRVDFPAGTVPCQYIDGRPLYSVSIVIFWDRDFTSPDDYLPANPPETPGERAVDLSFLGSGWGGGDVILAVPSVGANARPAEQLEVKENQWLMASGRHFYPYDHDGDPNTQAISVPVYVHKWYRIIAASDVENEDANSNGSVDPGEDANGNGGLDWVRYVTLDGPDWPLDPTDVFEAVLLSGVIGVYTTTVEVD